MAASWTPVRVPQQRHRRPARSAAPRVAAGHLLGLAVAVAAASAAGQTFQTWRGENTQNTWQDANAWWNFPNTSPIVFGQQEWDNNVQLTQQNNNGGNELSTYRWLYKANASQAHTFQGDPVRFFDFGGNDPGIYNESAATHLINLPVSGDGGGDPFQLHFNSTGGLTFGSTVNNQGLTIEVLGSAAGAKNLTFQGVVSGAGGMFVNNPNVTVVFDAANTQSGQLTLNAGVARLGGAGDSFGSSGQAIRIGAGASLDLNGVSASVGTVAEEGTGDGGTISLGNGTLTITGDSSGLFQNSISGSGGSLVKNGTGTLTLYGSQTYSGTTTVGGGTLSTSVALASTAVVLNAGGSLQTSAANLIADSAAVTLSGGTLELGNAETFGSGGVTLSAASTSTILPASGFTAIVGGGLSGSGSLVKAGAGTLQLDAAAGSFSGAVSIDAGTLAANASSALGTGGVTIASGATLRLGGVLPNAITNSGGTVLYAGGGVARTSTVSGGLATVASLVAGTSASPVSLAPVTAWTSRPANTYSDAVDLSGTSGTVQVLQMSYAPGILGSVPESDLGLGWSNGGTWVNAVNGNVGAVGGSAVVNGSGSYTSLGILPTTAFLGSWGRDTVNNVVWAVVDHNSDFAVVVVPEPAVAGWLAAAAFGGWLVRGARRGYRGRPRREILSAA